MKNVLKTTATVIAMSAIFAGPASAMVSKGDLARDINSKLNGGSNIIVQESNGVVTLTGYYTDAGEKAAAINAANQTEGVTKVIDLAFPSS